VIRQKLSNYIVGSLKMESRMKQNIYAAIVLILTASAWAGDEIKIMKDRLSNDRRAVTVTVEYALESLQECDLMIGLDYDSRGKSIMATNTVRLHKGKGKVDITAPVEDQKWRDSISKTVYVQSLTRG
jgi:hypothetical protein